MSAPWLSRGGAVCDRAIEAYRTLGDRGAATEASARFEGLIEAGEIRRATEVLEATLAEAETLGDERVLALTLATLARAHMRAANSKRAVELADRALDIAELLNLEPIIAEAFVNKGAALSILGRRREAAAIQQAALDVVQRVGDRSLEMRIRNNLASSLADDDPAGATRMFIETRALAREVGDRGMYNWVAGMAAITSLSAGADLDEHIAILHEALESATCRSIEAHENLLGVIEGTRPHADKVRPTSPSWWAHSPIRIAVRPAHGACHMPISPGPRHGLRGYDAAWELPPQNPEVPLAWR